MARRLSTIQYLAYSKQNIKASVKYNSRYQIKKAPLDHCSNMKYILMHLFLSLLLLNASCRHDPIYPPGYDPSKNPISTGLPCNPDTAYFVNDILPIMISNCAMSGCHDAQTKADGVQLTSYATIMQSGTVRAGDPNESDLYEVLIESRDDKRMPQPPYPRLDAAKIELVRKWIQQGAQNNACLDNAGECDTINMTYTSHIAPIINSNCTGCHSGNNPSGNVLLTNYNQVASVASNGLLLAVVSHSPGVAAMPPGNRLSDCNVNKIKAWANQGRPQ